MRPSGGKTVFREMAHSQDRPRAASPVARPRQPRHQDLQRPAGKGIGGQYAYASAADRPVPTWWSRIVSEAVEIAGIGPHGHPNCSATASGTCLLMSGWTRG